MLSNDHKEKNKTRDFVKLPIKNLIGKVIFTTGGGSTEILKDILDGIFRYDNETSLVKISLE